MPETHVIVQCELERVNALPADAVVNTWHFQAEDDVISPDIEEQGPGMLDRLETFYQALSAYWSKGLSGQIRAKVYDFAHEEPRVPVLERQFSTSTSSTALPGEVAICLSFEAAVSSGQRRARRRGRVYLGPLASTVSQIASGDSDARPDATVRSTILTAGRELADSAETDGFKLATFSPTELATGGSVSDAWNLVENLWVDNAFDIQRRRGCQATARSSGAPIPG